MQELITSSLSELKRKMKSKMLFFKVGEVFVHGTKTDLYGALGRLDFMAHCRFNDKVFTIHFLEGREKK